LDLEANGIICNQKMDLKRSQALIGLSPSPMTEASGYNSGKASEIDRCNGNLDNPRQRRTE
jgi:hypothetical protein